MELILLFGGLLYFIPMIVALLGNKKRQGAIIVLNLLLGWTLIGWVAALIWAMCESKEPPRPIKANNPT